MIPSRRDLVAGAGAAAFAALPGAPAHAFAPQVGKQNASFYRYKLGAFEITAVADGSATFPLAEGFVKNVGKDEVNKALEAANLPKDQVTIVFTPIVVNTGAKLVVIDTGYGPAALEKSGGKNGQFHSNLAAAGVDRANVDAVVISHFHGDHINGLVTADGKPAFANAEILVPAPEWKFWMDDGNMSRAPEGARPGFQNARRVFEALGNKVTQYEPGKDVVPGIQAIATHGHTPGHVSLAVASGSDSMLVTCDLTNRPELFLANPGWHLMYDMDAAMAEATRRRMFDMAVADKMRVQGFHYPFPANGRIEKTDAGYRFAPTPWAASL
ncbi:MAG: MBL fold metallo-hydrolase [Rhodoblastus sp.]